MGDFNGELQGEEMSDQAPQEAVCFTHYCEYEPEPWLAIHRETALEMLKGYNLTHEQKTDVAWLMAGYCRLLDEAGLIHYGQTEAEAVAKACGLK